MYLSEKGKGISASPTLAIDSKYKAMLADGQDAVGFGVGEPDFDTPDNIKKAAIDAIMTGKTKYTPASGLPALKKAVCDKLMRENGLSYETNQIVISNGAKHSLINTFMAILNPGDEVIIPAPYWVSYPEMVKIADGVPVYLQTKGENNFKFTAADLEKVCTEKTRALILNSPSNPTGAVFSKDELKDIADFAVKHNIYVVADEIYEHLIYGDIKSNVSIASFGEDIKKLTIIVNGLSKSYAMTGWRIGYTASAPEIAKVMSNIQSHASSNPNTIAQYAAIEALNGPQESVEEMRKVFEERRNYMVERIDNINGISCVHPDGAFYIMMNISEFKGKTLAGKLINSSDDFCQAFLENYKVAVVPGSGFGADDYVRWSYAVSMDTIKKGIDRLEEFLNS